MNQACYSSSVLKVLFLTHLSEMFDIFGLEHRSMHFFFCCRYKKYRVRCHHCWNIPKKDAKSNSKCLKCGDVLWLNSQQKCSSW